MPELALVRYWECDNAVCVCVLQRFTEKKPRTSTV